MCLGVGYKWFQGARPRLDGSSLDSTDLGKPEAGYGMNSSENKDLKDFFVTQDLNWLHVKHRSYF